VKTLILLILCAMLYFFLGFYIYDKLDYKERHSSVNSFPSDSFWFALRCSFWVGWFLGLSFLILKLAAMDA